MPGAGEHSARPGVQVALGRMADRLTLAMLTAAMIVASALVASADVPANQAAFSVLGVPGPAAVLFVIASLAGVWLIARTLLEGTLR
jgi:hypothetical protein